MRQDGQTSCWLVVGFCAPRLVLSEYFGLGRVGMGYVTSGRFACQDLPQAPP